MDRPEGLGPGLEAHPVRALNGSPGAGGAQESVPAWLGAAARVFPVTVDPSVSSVNSNGTTYVLSGYTSDFSGGPEIDAGTYDGGTNVARTFMKFDGVSSSLANDNVLGVRLGVFNTWS